MRYRGRRGRYGRGRRVFSRRRGGLRRRIGFRL